MEIRAMAIALLSTPGTAEGSRGPVFRAADRHAPRNAVYRVPCGGLMVRAALVELLIGVKAERDPSRHRGAAHSDPPGDRASA